MPRSANRPPSPKERPVALTMTGAPSLRALPPRVERLPPSPTFQGPRQTKMTTTTRADMVAFWVFVALIVLGMAAAARALMVM